MLYFIDRPISSAIRAARRLRRTEVNPSEPITALEPPSGVRGWRRLPRDVEIAQFFAGDLRTDEGDTASLAAYRVAGDLALEEAQATVAKIPFLSELEESLGTGVVALRIAKQTWMEARWFVVRILVTRALAQKAGEGATLLLPRPLYFSPEMLERVTPHVTVKFYRQRLAIPIGPWIVVRVLLSGLKLRLKRLTKRHAANGLSSGRPVVLVTHEDLLTTDRSIRCQPHWLDPAQPRPPFDTLMFPTTQSLPGELGEGLAELGVTGLTERALAAYWRQASNDPTIRALRSYSRRALAGLLLVRSIEDMFAMAQAWLLLEHAQRIGSVAVCLPVRALLTGEPHMIHADAMSVTASVLGVPLVSYQYSNLAVSSPAMILPADRMALFSETFKPLWTADGVRVPSWSITGYPYDALFPLVKERASALRRSLGEAGATFVVCYFDESEQDDRYGVPTREHHREEILTLVRKLLDDPHMGLVVKSQFASNTPSLLYPEEEEIRALQATGRYVELLRGTPRNVVLPAEAALSADMAIGHMLGATAGLEAALTGCRCILLDPFTQVRHNRELLDRSRIVYSSLNEALTDLDRYRRGDPEARDVGDWDQILHHFDPHQDGGAARRLRDLLEESILNGVVSEG